MFPKSVGNSGQSRTQNSWRWSITRRLVFAYTLSAIVMLAITYVFLNWTIHDTLVKAENEYIDDRIRVFRAIIESRPDFVDIIRRDIGWEGAYAEFPEYYARIQDTQCRTLVETPRMEKLIPAHRFPQPCVVGKEVQNQTRSGRTVILRGTNGRMYLLKSYWTDTVNPSQRLAIQIAVDITSERGLIQTNQRRMMAIVIPGIVFAFLFSVLVARRVLLPLSELAGLARRITIDKIGMRVKDPLRWPMELRAPALAFNEMLDRLNKSFVQISRYTSNLAHELRTPINNLMGEAEVALSQERTTDEYRKVLESGLEEHMRLTRMIDALLFLTRSENPANPIECSSFDPLDEIKKVCNFYEALGEEKQAQITWHGDGVLYGDPLLFRRTMSNLVSNALYYSAPGVKIDISVRKNSDNSLDVAVSDTGFGIHEEDQKNVFDRFFRVMNSRACNPKGSGLGLSIVKLIMDMHKGSVVLQSVPGQGTTVTLHFPAAPPEPLDIASSSPSL